VLYWKIRDAIKLKTAPVAAYFFLAKDAAIYVAINWWRWVCGTKTKNLHKQTINNNGAREGTRTPTPYGAGT
jgi:hypothetical protein